MVLKSGVSLAVSISNSGSADDLDGLEASSVTSSHIVVEGVDCAVEGDVTVLTIHIMSTGAGVVLNPDTKVLDGSWVLLGDL